MRRVLLLAVFVAACGPTASDPGSTTGGETPVADAAWACPGTAAPRDYGAAPLRPASVEVDRGESCSDECAAAVASDGSVLPTVHASDRTYVVTHHDDNVEPGVMYFALDSGSTRFAECRCESADPASQVCDAIPAPPP